MSFYLDDAATTKPSKEVIAAMMPYMSDKWHNPSSLYSDSTYASIAIDKSKRTISDFINARQEEIYFTSGGSESNCWAIQGFVHSRTARRKLAYIITTPIEHKSIIECVNDQDMSVVHYLSVDKNGFVSLEELDDVICFLIENGAEPNDILVSIQFANNEIGTVQDVIGISNIVHLYGCVFHTDAVQAFGHIPIDVDAMGIDMMSASAHKIGGCKGIGILYIKSGIKIKPLIYGSQMNGMRGGTENVAGIVGMGRAVQACATNKIYSQSIRASRDYFIDRLIGIGCRLNGPKENRLPNNINVTLPYNINGETLLYSLDVDDIQIGTGSACNSRSMEASHVLKSIGLSDNEAQRSIRVTVPENIAFDDIDNIVETINKEMLVLKGLEKFY